MSLKKFSTEQNIWFKVGFRIVCSNRKIELKALPDHADAHHRVFLKWRIAYNFYRAGDYKEAIEILKDLLFESSVPESDPLHDFYSDNYFNQKSFINEIAGRCWMKLYLATGSHDCLENGYRQFEKAVEHMHFDLYAMFSLPKILLELGRSMEYYGSYKAAMETYTKILTNFPNFKGYFDTMYRGAIVGRILAKTMTNAPKRIETIKKCVDVFSFLLEAIPDTINELHLVFLFARTLETSGNPGLKYKSAGIYKSLHTICKPLQLADAHTQRLKDPKDWVEESYVFVKIADSIMADEEYIIARECYEKYFEEKAIKASTGQDLTVIHVETYLKMAKCCALLQNIPEAIKYAEGALGVSPYHPETRQLLSKWSKKYAQRFSKEMNGIGRIKALWKGRCWSFRFQRLLRQKVLSDMEDRIAKNRYDMEARKVLAYLAKLKWRAVFAYEDRCASVIQQFVRKKAEEWRSTAQQRRKMELRATDTQKKYLKRPLDQSIRKEVRAITNNRFCPKKHSIREIRLQIDAEDKAWHLVAKGAKSYFFRKAVWVKIEERKAAAERVRRIAATKIQVFIRKKLRRIHQRRLVRPIQRWKKAAIVLQRFFRRKLASFELEVTSGQRPEKSDKYLRRAALKTLKRLLVPHFKVYLQSLRKWAPSQHDSAHGSGSANLPPSWHGRRPNRKMQVAAVRLQRFFWVTLVQWRQKTLIETLQMRKQTHVSLLTARWLNYLYPGTGKQRLSRALLGGTSMSVPDQQAVTYTIPGFRAHSPAFNALLQQHTVVCCGREAHNTIRRSMDDGGGSDPDPTLTLSSFSAADCLMLSLVLKNKFCAIKQLLLLEIDADVARNPCFEFDLLPALKQCVSCVGVTVSGSGFTETFLTGLIQVVRVDNPRIADLRIELLRPYVSLPTASSSSPSTKPSSADRGPTGLASSRHLSPLFLSAAADLLSDYFNYSIPALRNLCLHGCGLRDADLTYLVRGIENNFSITSLWLSKNLITDSGLLTLIQAIRRNQRTHISILDLSDNLIQLKGHVHRYFQSLDASPRSHTASIDLNESSSIGSLSKASSSKTFKRFTMSLTAGSTTEGTHSSTRNIKVDLLLVRNPILKQYFAPVQFETFFEIKAFQVHLVYSERDAAAVIDGRSLDDPSPAIEKVKPTNRAKRKKVISSALSGLR